MGTEKGRHHALVQSQGLGSRTKVARKSGPGGQAGGSGPQTPASLFLGVGICRLGWRIKGERRKCHQQKLYFSFLAERRPDEKAALATEGRQWTHQACLFGRGHILTSKANLSPPSWSPFPQAQPRLKLR